MTIRGCSPPTPTASSNHATRLAHQPGGVERAGGLKDDADLVAARIEGRDAVGRGLVVAPVPLVLVAVAQEVAVQLLDVVLGDRDVGRGREDRLHDLCVAGNLLLVAGAEGLDVQVRQQPLHLPIRQLAALDAGRGADALDGRDPAQRGEPLRRQRPQGAPSTLELIDLGDEGEHLRGNLQGGEVDHRLFLHPLTPVYQPTKTPDNTQFGARAGSALPFCHCGV